VSANTHVERMGAGGLLERDVRRFVARDAGSIEHLVSRRVEPCRAATGPEVAGA
jgi:hypothetical protein